MPFTINVAGTKPFAKAQVKAQVKDEALCSALCVLIDRAPGNCVSLSGCLSAGVDASFGSIGLSGSFWTGA